MITVRRAAERIRTIHRGHETIHSFDPQNPSDPIRDGFRSLECLREEWLAPGVAFEFRAPRSLEVLTYVWKGALRLDDPTGERIPLELGDCHRATLKDGALCRLSNESKMETARVFQGFLTPERELLRIPGEKRRFSLSDRRGVLRLMFSRDGRESSLRLRQDAGVYSSILDLGHHLVHELRSGRGAWLHVVSGRLQLAGQLLVAGDGASFLEEPAVSMTAREASEILLFDLV